MLFENHMLLLFDLENNFRKQFHDTFYFSITYGASKVAFQAHKWSVVVISQILKWLILVTLVKLYNPCKCHTTTYAILCLIRLYHCVWKLHHSILSSLPPELTKPIDQGSPWQNDAWLFLSVDYLGQATLGHYYQFC
jgi:hypothetical protein